MRCISSGVNTAVVHQQGTGAASLWRCSMAQALD
jgi:hypothetical protein